MNTARLSYRNRGGNYPHDMPVPNNDYYLEFSHSKLLVAMRSLISDPTVTPDSTVGFIHHKYPSLLDDLHHALIADGKVNWHLDAVFAMVNTVIYKEDPSSPVLKIQFPNCTIPLVI